MIAEIKNCLEKMNTNVSNAITKVKKTNNTLTPCYNVLTIFTEGNYLTKKKSTPTLRRVLSFGRYLRKEMGKTDPLYSFIVSFINVLIKFRKPKDIVLQDEIPVMLCDVATIMITNLKFKFGVFHQPNHYPYSSRELEILFEDFEVFLNVVIERIAIQNAVSDSLMEQNVERRNKGFKKEVQTMIKVIDKCLEGLDQCLEYVQSMGLNGEREPCKLMLAILKKLIESSTLFTDAQETMLKNITKRCEPLSDAAVISFGGENDCWLLDHDLLNRRARISLVQLLLPRIEENLRYVSIDRSNILGESYDVIMSANRDELLLSLLIAFRGEDDVGKGLTREWFAALFGEIFTSSDSNRLFFPCPEDGSRFYPNPRGRSSRCQRIYHFTGIMIALALAHHIPVGICIDNVVYKLMAGKNVTWVDIVNQEPAMYRSLEAILEMDEAALRDMDLRFTHLVLENEIELCENGSDTALGIENRVRYCELLTQKHIVDPIQNLVDEMLAGFSEIMGGLVPTQSFFKRCSLNDLDLLLLGSKSISVADWEECTNLEGFGPNDNEPIWFWQMVTAMSMEERISLLFYWSSMKNLPIGEFHSLPMKFLIRRADGAIDGIPSSSTCFFTLRIAAYSSYNTMVDRFKEILNSL